MLSSVLWGVFGVSAFLAVLIVICGIYYRHVAGIASVTTKMDGKTVIITGASAGIGKEAARDMARRGARVIMGCRNLEKASKVADEIQSTTGNKDVFVKRLDTSCLASVRSFAAEILSQENRIDVLVLNAGIGGMDDRCVTSDDLEITMATNHFGHFLLGNLLLGRLKESSPSRVVITASIAHKVITTLDTENLNFEKGGFDSFNYAYCQSKACNILFSRRLADITTGTGVVVNSLCPGLVNTEIFEKAPGGFIIGQLYRCLVPFMGKTVTQGAQTIIYLSVSEEVADVTGKYFEDCKESKNATALVQDDGLAKKLWEVSETLVHLQPNERCY